MKVSIGDIPSDDAETQEVEVEISKDDTYNLDYTLALIIHPALIALKKDKRGAPYVDDEDVPENIRKSSAPKVEEWEADIYFFDRWNYVLDEMINAFNPSGWWDDDRTEDNTKRIKNGWRLFGKYYQNLWR